MGAKSKIQSICILIIFLLVVNSCSSKQEQQLISDKQTTPIEQATTQAQVKIDCPHKGAFQSDEEYCVELCIFGKTGIAPACESMCAQAARLDGDYSTSVMDKRVQGYKCTRCGDCTPEQLAKIEEQKNTEEELTIANQKAALDAKNQTEEVQRIKDENTRIQEQKNIELENQINTQSDKLNGFVYIKNKSGEGRQFSENGITYDFPYPPIESTKVPVDLGRRLLATPYFELVIT